MAASSRLKTPTASPEDGASGGSSDTPAVRQYWAAKRAHPDCLVLFRLGDFYELFGEDAERAAPILGVTLTARAFGRAGRMPMCGVPQHSLDTYARRLLEAGLKVAVCDQVEAPRPGRLVARRVVRVLTAGTLIEDSLLPSGASARCVAIAAADGGVGLAAVDVSTGDCQLRILRAGSNSPALGYQLAALEAAELLLAVGSEVPEGLPARVAVSWRPLSSFDDARGQEMVREARGSEGEPGEGAGQRLALAALAAVGEYCRETESELSPGFLSVSWLAPESVMALDPAARRNLELTDPIGSGSTLVRLIDRTLTPLGSRRLRTWVMEPLSSLGPIHQRQEAVLELVEGGSLRARLREYLRGCRDLERLVGRCVHGNAGPRDLASLAATLDRLPELASELAGAGSPVLASIAAELARPGAELASLLRRALVEEPPAQARDGGFVRPGFDDQLDRIRSASSGAREYLSRLEERERQRTGIKGLRVGYNRVFGYYIEIRNSARDSVPDDYVRRQTLVGSERYVTSELKEQENVVLTARERALERELECLAWLIGAAVEAVAEVGAAASGLGALDALQSLAQAGVELGWTMPIIDDGLSLELIQSRHPLVEEALGSGRFVPNDIVLDGGSERIWLLTGPNMAGKSTFLRQVALVCLLGQVGSMVPCRRARWGLVDRIFTRVGAQDDLAAGRSTFLVEMEEMALILDQATPRSLVILDELGRGTSTFDGMSIAQAILEHLHEHPGMPRRVIFATHYHELTALEEKLPGLRNYRVEVVETEEDGDARVVFLHRIAAGGADRSYGINVAQLAGLPRGVLDRAGRILAEREAATPLEGSAGPDQQLALPLASPHPVILELEQLRLDGMTPLEALQQIADWQRRAGERS